MTTPALQGVVGHPLIEALNEGGKDEEDDIIEFSSISYLLDSYACYRWGL